MSDKLQIVKEFLTDNIFNLSNTINFIWVLGIFFIIYFLFEPGQEIMTRIVNIIIMVWVTYAIIYLVLSFTEEEKKHLLDTSVIKTIEFFEDDKMILWMLLDLIVFYVILYILQIPTRGENVPFMVELIEIKLWLTVLMLLGILFFKYILQIDTIDLINEILGYGETKQTTPAAAAPAAAPAAPPPPPQKDEVFNINKNLYNYQNAEAICKVYDARLATYNEIEDAYNNGAEWCNYGWSANQMAFFPTQKKTWEKLQEKESTKYSCGRPGVNGGYFPNKNLKFGVNCYGKKPKLTDEEKLRIEKEKEKTEQALKSTEDTAVSEQESELVKFWKKNFNTLELNPFNSEKWNAY